MGTVNEHRGGAYDHLQSTLRLRRQGGSAPGLCLSEGKGTPTIPSGLGRPRGGAYHALPPEAKTEFQDLCDFTVGRTIASLLPLLGEEHEVIRNLRSITKGTLPSSPDDFPDRRAK